MSDVRRPLAILFVDISESSKLYRDHGDRRAFEILTALLDGLAVVVTSFGGSVVDRIGDELMTTFPDLRAALRAAVELQWTTCRFSEEHFSSTGRLAVRIGLHFGEVLASDGRPIGRAVYRAKRVVETAKAHQIVLDAETCRCIEDPAQWTLRPIQITGLKGQDGQGELLELVWNEVEATRRFEDRDIPRTSAAELLLEAGNMSVRLSPHQRLSLGRLPPCDVVLPSSVVSRLHARIISRGRGFYFRDESMNGSFVLEDASPPSRFLHREETLLQGSGWIGLGEAPEAGSVHSVRYHCLPLETRT